MKNLFPLVLLLLGLLAHVGCKESPEKTDRMYSTPGVQAEAVPKVQADAEGISSGGGGGFLHKNSKLLLEQTKLRLLDLIKESPSDIYESLGEGWNKEKVYDIFDNLLEAPEESEVRNETDELLYDYGLDEKSQKPFLKVLKPFFDYYSSVPIKGPKGSYYYRVQTQIIIELFHELSHVVLKHPKGKVSAKDVIKIEAEASKFADDLFKSIVSEGLVCSGDFSPEMFGIKQEKTDVEEGAETQETEPKEKIFWIFLKYGGRGISLKVASLEEGRDVIEKIYKNEMLMDDLSYLRDDAGLVANVSEGASFPPFPKFKTFFGGLSDSDAVSHTVLYDLAGEPGALEIDIYKYEQGFSEGIPSGGGLISRFEALEDVIWSERSTVDYSESYHKILVEDAESSYEYYNVEKDILADPRDDEEVVEEDDRRSIPLDCDDIYKSFELPAVWGN